MSFQVSEQGEAEHKIILLENTAIGTKAQIYAFGALLNVFSVKYKDVDRNIVEGFQDTKDAIRNIVPGFQSAKLNPFVCRLKEGRYTFANVKYRIEKYYYYREALHGLVYDAVFSVTETGATNEEAFVVLSYNYNQDDPGFPFFYRLQITYRLRSGNELSITTEVTNLSSEAIPVSDGWHPYFSFGKKVDELELLIRTEEMVEFDSHLLPTGQLIPYHTFSHLKKIGDTQLDNSFVLQTENNGMPACILSDTKDGLHLHIFPDKSYPYIQLFIPDHRNSIAIENLSSLPDALNNGVGLLILEPSASTTFATKFVIETNT